MRRPHEDEDEEPTVVGQSRVELVGADANADAGASAGDENADVPDKLATRKRKAWVVPPPTRRQLQADLGLLHKALVALGVQAPSAGRSRAAQLFHGVYASFVLLLLLFRIVRLLLQDELTPRVYSLVLFAPLVVFLVSLQALGPRGVLRRAVRGHARICGVLCARDLTDDEARRQTEAVRTMVRAKSRTFTYMVSCLFVILMLSWNVARFVWMADPSDELPSRTETVNVVDEWLADRIGGRGTLVLLGFTDLYLMGQVYCVAAFLLSVYTVDAQQRLVLSFIDNDERRRADQFTVAEIGCDVSLLPIEDDEMPPRVLLRAHRITRGLWSSLIKFERRIVLVIVPCLVVSFGVLCAELWFTRGVTPHRSFFVPPLVVLLGTAIAIEYELQLRRTSSRILFNFEKATGFNPHEVLEDGVGPLGGAGPMNRPVLGAGVLGAAPSSVESNASDASADGDFRPELRDREAARYEKQRKEQMERAKAERAASARGATPQPSAGPAPASASMASTTHNGSAPYDSDSDNDEDEYNEFRRKAYTGKYNLTPGEQESDGVDRFQYVAPTISFNRIFTVVMPIFAWAFGIALIVIGVMSIRMGVQFPACEETVTRDQEDLVIEEDASDCSDRKRMYMDIETSFFAQPALWLSTLWLTGVLFGFHTLRRYKWVLLVPPMVLIVSAAVGIYVFTDQDDGPAWQFTAVSATVTVTLMLYLSVSLSVLARSWRLFALLFGNIALLTATVAAVKFIVLAYLEAGTNDEQFSVVVVALPLLEVCISGSAFELAEWLFETRFPRTLESPGGHPVDRVSHSFVLTVVPNVFFKLLGRCLVFGLSTFSSQVLSVVILLLMEVLSRVTIASRFGVAYHLRYLCRRPARAMEKMEHKRTNPTTAHYVYVGMMTEMTAVFAAFGITLVGRGIYNLPIQFSSLVGSLAVQVVFEVLTDVSSVYFEETALDIYLLGFWEYANDTLYYIWPSSFFFYVATTSLGLEMSAIVRYADIGSLPG